MYTVKNSCNSLYQYVLYYRGYQGMPILQCLMGTQELMQQRMLNVTCSATLYGIHYSPKMSPRLSVKASSSLIKTFVPKQKKR